MKEMQIQFLCWEDHLEKEMETHSSTCLGNSMDRGAWWAIIHKVAEKLDTTEWLNNNKEKSPKQELFPGMFSKENASLWFLLP